MTRTKKISAMNFADRANEILSRPVLDALLEKLSFRTVSDLMVDAVIIIDIEGNLAFLNRAAEKLSGVKRADVEKRSFENFLRRSGLDINDWFADAIKGRREGLVRLRTSGTLIPVTSRIIAVSGYNRGYVLMTLKTAPSHGLKTGRNISGLDMNIHNLVLCPDLEKKVGHAIRAYQRNARVLLLGESGVGKTAIARFIHDQATSKDTAFIHVNCGSITETLFESELFGYERGAFTGALQAGKKGFIETARGGTLFLDEIGEIPLASQAKLLKFLEDGTIQPVGSVVSKQIETTVITATNRNLRSMVEEGTFRRDLFYRISIFPVTIPPLRERSDKEALLDVFLDRINAHRQPKLTLSSECRKRLLACDFIGNMRELRSIIEYLDIVADDIAKPEHLDSDVFAASATIKEAHEPEDADFDHGITLKCRVQDYENRLIDEALSKSSSKREAARALGIDVATLIRKQARTSEGL